MAPLVEQLTLAQVMTSQLMGLCPALGAVLTTQSLEPEFQILCLPLSAPPPLLRCARSLSLSQN